MNKHLLKKLTLSLIFLLFIGELSYAQCSEIIFRDEFDGSSVDQSKWVSITGDGCPTLCGFGNSEEQWYSPNNTAVKDGNLVITTKHESVGGKDFTSSKLVTSGKFSSKYGRYEASIKLPSAGGIWPAFWMLPENGDWPFTGEIDIMEAKHKNPDNIGGTVHYNNNGWRYKGRDFHAGLDLSAGFHEYAVEWEPTEIRWYVDGQLYHTVTPATTVDPWPFSEGEWYIILNVAVGGRNTPYTGRIDPIPADYPTQMEVDYVRVYSGTFNAELTGNNTVYEGDTNKTYTVTPTDGASYNWTVPAGASITSGQGTNSITVDWAATGGEVNVTVNSSNCGVNTYSMNVTVEAQRVLDFMFEDFESNRNITYGSNTSGDLRESIANPGSNATNNSAVVGRYKRDPNSQYDVLDMESSEIGNALEFTSGKRTISMDVYSDAPLGTEVIVQLENGALSSNPWPAGRHSRYNAKTTTQNRWETLEFELMDTPDTSVGAFDVNQMSLLISANSYTAHTMYFDNVRSMKSPDEEVLDEQIIADYDAINQLDPILINGVYTPNSSNPAPNSVNNSAMVAKYVRNETELYDVASFSTNVIEDSQSFKDGDHIFYMDVYTTADLGTKITLSLENEALSAGTYPIGRNSQYAGIVTEKNAWHTVAFTYTSSPDTGTSNFAVNEITILFDPNSNASDTYYFDNFKYGITALPETYNFSEMIQNYNGSNTLTFDSNTTGVYTANVSNPSTNSVNGSSRAAKYVRNSSELYDVLFFDTDFIKDASTYVSEEKRFALDIYTDAPVGTVITWQLEASSVSTSTNYPLGRHSVYHATVKERNNWHTLEFVITGTPDIVLNDDQIDTIAFLMSPNSASGDTFYVDNLRSLSKEDTNSVPVLSSITITSTNTTIESGQTAQFSAQAFDQNGILFQTTFDWTATGGSINSDGLYTGSEIGTYIVTATSGSITGSASITVTQPIPVLSSITVTTDKATINQGQTTQFSAQAFDQYGAIFQTNVVWTENGGAINPNGLYTGSETGTYRITATSGDISGSAAITVTQATPVLSSITVTTDKATINQGQTAQFGAKGYDQYGAIFQTNVVWTENGGSINPNGLYTGSETGTYTITATSGSIAGSASITVTEILESFIEIPGIVEAEDYKEGGEGKGFYDTTPGNNGGAYRADNVDIESTTGGYNVGWIAAGEWLAYDIDALDSSDGYAIAFRVASPNGNGKFHLELDGVSITDIISVPNTGGWQNYQTVEVKDIIIENGSHELRIVFDASGLNVDNIVFSVSPEENYCSDIADNGQFSYLISMDTNNPTITYVPEITGMGDTICILYYGTSATGMYPGYNVTPNEPFEINAEEGEEIYFYYTYSMPNGKENNTKKSRKSFTVGSCGIRSTVESTNNFDVTIFPNPIQDKIALSGLYNAYLLNVYTMKGTLVKSASLSKEQIRVEINVSSLPKGMYVVKVYNQKREPSIHKILKN